MKKIIKYIFIFQLLIFGILVLTLGIIQTRMFKNWLRDKIIQVAQSQLDGNVSMRSITGNLLTNFSIHDLSVEKSNEPIIRVARLDARYHPVSLFNKEVLVRKLVLDSPQIELKRSTNGKWNISELFKSDTTKTEKADTSKSDWAVEIESFQINSGSMEIQGFDSSQIKVPQFVRDINLNLSFKYLKNKLTVNLTDFNFRTRSPDFHFLTVKTDFKLEQGDLSAMGTTLRTDSTLLQSDLKIVDLKNPKLDVSFDGKPISLSEVRRVIPNLELYGNPKIELNMNGPLNDLNINLKLAIGNGKVDLIGNVDLKNKPFQYQVAGSLSKINLAEITHQANLKSNWNLKLKLDGKGTTWGKMVADCWLEIQPSSMRDKSLKSGMLTAKIRQDSLMVSGNLDAMEASSQFAGRYIFNKNNVEYQLKGTFKQLDLSNWVADSTLSTNLNFDVDIAGKGFNLTNLSGRYFLNLSQSNVKGIQIDTTVIQAFLENKKLKVDDFLFSSPLARVTAAGTLGGSGDNSITFDANIDDVNRLSQMFALDSIWGQGKIAGEISGGLDSVFVDAQLDFAELGISDLNFQKLAGEFSGYFFQRKNQFTISANSSKTQAFGIKDLTPDFKLTYTDSLVDYDIKVQQKENVFIETRGNLEFLTGGFDIKIEGLAINIFDQNWQKQGPETKIIFQNSAVEVSDLTLVSDEGQIQLFGEMSPESETDIHLQVDSLNLQKFVHLLDKKLPINGSLDLATRLSGKLNAPVVNGNFILKNLEYAGESGQSLAGNIDYSNEKLSWKVELSKLSDEPILLSTGNLPINFSLSPYQNKFSEEDSLEFKLNAQNMNLSFFQSFIDYPSGIKGTLNADIKIYNTIGDLKGEGPLKITNGELSISDLGTKYSDINILVALKEKEVVIDQFRVKSGDGNLKFVEGSLSLSKRSIQDFKAILVADKFKVMNTRTLNAAVNGRIELSGSINALQFRGDLTVPEARIYYPALFGDQNVVELRSQPFFVIGADSFEFDPKGAKRFQEKEAEIKKPFSDTEFYKNLEASLSLKFPRNTWIRSEEANVEMQGNLDLIKEGKNFTLFGSLSAVRGYYELQGNRFQIEEGEIRFKGNPEINPDININALYEFREQVEGEEKQREVRVIITGTAQAPKFEFTLDGQEAEQKDILSILLFGRTFDNLPIGQRNNVASETSLSDQATGFVTGQLIKQLSSRLGTELNLDVLQIESGQDLQDTRVKIGKYITPDVYVVVSQDFGAQGNQKIELEYEIPQKILFFNLFLQALKEREGDTVMDVIWKIEW